MYNPSLRREPRYEPAGVIPLEQETSILDWLSANGRLIPRESLDRDSFELFEEEDEVAELIEVEDHFYDEEEDLEVEFEETEE